MNKNELIKRVKTIQNFVVWASFFLLSLSLLSEIKNEIILFVALFFVSFSYILSGLNFMRLCGYVGDDLSTNFANFYIKHKTGIKAFFNWAGYLMGTVIIGFGIYFLIILPDDSKIDRIIGLFGIFLAVITYFKTKK